MLDIRIPNWTWFTFFLHFIATIADLSAPKLRSRFVDRRGNGGRVTVRRATRGALEWTIWLRTSCLSTTGWKESLFNETRIFDSNDCGPSRSTDGAPFSW